MKPNVEWIPDGLRFCGDQKQREKLHKYLKSLYIKYGFKNKVFEINDNNYHDRLNKINFICNKLIK